MSGWPFTCVHRHTWREQDGAGRWYLVCHRCGHRAPILARTEAERARMAAQYPVPARRVSRKGDR